VRFPSLLPCSTALALSFPSPATIPAAQETFIHAQKPPVPFPSPANNPAARARSTAKPPSSGTKTCRNSSGRCSRATATSTTTTNKASSCRRRAEAGQALQRKWGRGETGKGNGADGIYQRYLMYGSWATAHRWPDWGPRPGKVMHSAYVRTDGRTDKRSLDRGDCAERGRGGKRERCFHALSRTLRSCVPCMHAQMDRWTDGWMRDGWWMGLGRECTDAYSRAVRRA
jgi:hypothetical protein